MFTKMNNLRICKVGFGITFLLLLANICYWKVLLFAPSIEPKTVISKSDGNNVVDLKSFGRWLSNEDRQVTQATRRERKKCSKPVSTFVYVKTHKTGSSTTKQLLFKFINYNNLSEFQALPYPDPYVGGYPGRFKCKFMVPRGSSIAVRHTRFDAKEMKKCFHSDTRYFTIIRKPWNNFLSTLNFFSERKLYIPSCFGMPKAYVKQGKTMGTEEFLSEAAFLLKPSVPFYFRFRNFQSHDLGIDPMLNDVNEIESQIKDLDENMDLVMLLEHYDESMILLKDLLCIDWEVLIRVGQGNRKSYKRTDLPTKKEKDNFEKLYNIDIALYDHFNRTFWERVDAYGRDKMAKDLEIFRKKRNKRKKRSIWENKRLPEGIRMGAKLEMELRNYMKENSGKCVYPRRYISV